MINLLKWLIAVAVAMLWPIVALVVYGVGIFFAVVFATHHWLWKGKQ